MVDNGEVVAMLDIAKCLYDAIARMERVSEKGKAAMMRVADSDDKYSIIEAFKEQMFRPCLAAIANADSTSVPEPFQWIMIYTTVCSKCLLSLMLDR